MIYAILKIGDFVYFYISYNIIHILLSGSYKSGSDLGTSTSTYNNLKFSSRVLMVGNYVYTFGQGGNADTWTVSIGQQTAAVSEMRLGA